jgi:hypothetical protein
MASFNWPAFWSADLDQPRREALARELSRELPPGHVLCGHSWTVLAVLGRDPDWVALQLEDGRLAAVHLTWRVETDTRWPYMALYNGLEELCQPSEWE